MEENLVHSSLDFLKVLEKFTLESKLLACQQFSSRIMTCSQVDMVKAYKENIMPWEIEAFAAYSIVYDNDDASEKLDGKTFADTITLIRNYWHSGLTAAEESGEYPEAFMMISALQQFPVQGVFLQKLYRYHYFFTFQNDKLDMKKVFFDKMGADYERLEEFASMVFLGFSKEAQDVIPPTELQIFLTKAFTDKDALRLLSIEKEEYKKQLFSLYKDNIIDQYYGLKIQYLYPFISGQDFTYVPSPYLVINAVTESMLNRITLGDGKLRRAIGKEVIEGYLYDIYDARSRGRIGIYKVAASVCRVVRSFKISVTKRSLKYGKCRYRLAVALELCFPFTVCSFDSRFNLSDSLGVGFWDDQADTVLRSATVDGFRFPDVGVVPACVRTGDNFHGICHFCIFTHCHIPP